MLAYCWAHVRRGFFDAGGKGDGAPIAVGALIESTHKIVTKKGDSMVFLQLLDHTGSMEAVVFPKTLQKYGHLIRDDIGIKIRGRLSYRDGRVSIIANDFKTF